MQTTSTPIKKSSDAYHVCVFRRLAGVPKWSMASAKHLTALPERAGGLGLKGLEYLNLTLGMAKFRYG